MNRLCGIPKPKLKKKESLYKCRKGDSLISRDSFVFRLRLRNATKAIHLYAGIYIKFLYFSALGLGLGLGFGLELVEPPKAAQLSLSQSLKPKSKSSAEKYRSLIELLAPFSKKLTYRPEIGLGPATSVSIWPKKK